MAEAAEKLSGKLGLDTTDFKTALTSANRELRVLESGFKASAAALGDWTKDATGLETRVKSLTDQIDIQKLKVAALAAEHQRLVQEQGENSRAAQEAEIKLNKETETLNKMEGELNNTEAALQEMTQGEEEIDPDGRWFLDLKCSLVESFRWSLHEIDQTDIESLIPFVFHYPHWKEHRSRGNGAVRQVYADQVDWL